MEPLFQTAVLNWFKAFGRKDLPWQQPKTPYRVWVSEIMLQQTQVKTVLGFFEAFIQVFPNIPALAQAPLDTVLRHWAGLGYYARARNLHKAAQVLHALEQQELPQNLEALINLPGIGRSTAGAILSLGHECSATILDGNVKRVLGRYFNLSEPFDSRAGSALYWSIAESLTPQNGSEAAAYNQAMMDLGATVCTLKQPTCHLCPLSQINCRGFEQQNWSQFPVKQKNIKKTKEIWELHVHLKKNHVLLEKRPSPGVWGELWCLPVKVQKKSQMPVLLAPAIRHELTHKTLTLLPLKGSLRKKEQENGRWFPLEDLKAGKVGLPKPIQTLIKLL